MLVKLIVEYTQSMIFERLKVAIFTDAKTTVHCIGMWAVSFSHGVAQISVYKQVVLFAGCT